ncbi:MAG TPA: UxaA family hydrolase [Verrucomicrobiae bacterium]|nr:UxaA family hydrolase [Verrucomicrobiae bacterium]
MTDISPKNASRALRLSPDDNVLVLLSSAEAGEFVTVEGARIRMASALPLGHKVAARNIAAGEKILKYGVPIGSATRAISAGEHVHTHNLRSDYLPGPLEL